MGAALGAVLRANGTGVCWASDGRSIETATRANHAGLTNVTTIAGVAEASDVVLSVCPPHAAQDVASLAARNGFRGLYVDANAVSPATSSRIGTTMSDAGADFVDGGVVGPPPGAARTTRLFLSGDRAREVAALFDDTVVETVVLDSSPVAASALKMSYAAYTKGSIALLIAVRELAGATGVDEALVEEWARSQPGLVDRLAGAQASASAKGWRWEAEMREIAATLADADLPPGFHEAAAEIFARFQRPQ
jgi:3-hydroxyisobutyrate dehydrogenase-like beta-hydroxyacid dehydrogenase